MEKSFKIEKNSVSEENILKWTLVQEGFEKADVMSAFLCPFKTHNAQMN